MTDMAPVLAGLDDDDTIELARVDPLVFARYVKGDRFQLYDYLGRIGDAVYDCVYGDLRRVQLAVPRRHGKTYFVAEQCIPWVLGVAEMRGRAVEIAYCTYGQEKSNDTMHRIMSTVQTPQFKRVFPRTRFTVEAIAGPKTAFGSQLYGLGVGGPFTGRGADYLFLDDLIKNYGQSRSEAYLAGLKYWYESSAYTSLYEDSTVISIGTRWCRRDIVGIMDEGPEKWLKLHLPAIIDEGTENERALCPERFSLKKLKTIRSTLTPHVWSTMYQGQPVEHSGECLGPPVREDVEPVKVIGYVDTAFGGGDSVAVVFGGLTKDGRHSIIRAALWPEHAVKMVPRIVDMARECGASLIVVENNADKGWCESAIRALGFPTRSDWATKGKVQRILYRVKANYSRILFGSRCSPEFILAVAEWHELAGHDDAADAVAGLIQTLEKKTTIKSGSIPVWG